jgi:hypothetical protein
MDHDKAKGLKSLFDRRLTMNVERLMGGTCEHPFPVYENLVESLLAAHRSVDDERDAIVAHVMATCAGYAYADTETVATMMTRLGLGTHACVRIERTVDAMFVASAAYLVQSQCGRAVILCYRGTEPANVSAWLGDADVGRESMTLGNQELRVHSGFYRNVRASRWEVVSELNLALQGRSLLDRETSVDHPLEALYVTGHSLGGAMAVLLSLSLMAEHGAIAQKLRAAYTFGQPLATGEPLPVIARDFAPRLFRHVMARDPVPGLPARTSGPLVHFGREYRCTNGNWRCVETPVAQMQNMRSVPRSVLPLLGMAGRRSPRYTLAEHAPHYYIAALRPKGRVTEFGDRG